MDEYKNVVCVTYNFQKKNLVQILFFGTALGRFNQCFSFVSFVFRRRPNMVADIFTQPPSPLPHHKKASYGPEIS